MRGPTPGVSTLDLVADGLTLVAADPATWQDSLRGWVLTVPATLTSVLPRRPAWGYAAALLRPDAVALAA